MQLCVPLYCITHLCPAHTTSGRVRLNLALDQKTVDFLRETAQGERGISEVIEDLAQERRTLGPIHARLERMTASYVALVRMLQLARIKQNLENLRRNHYAPNVMCETNVLRSQGAKPCAPSKATFPRMRCRP
jgi:hypothetical protein